VYVLPPALVIIGLATLAVVLPRWRRRSRAQAADAQRAPPAPLPEAERRRLDQELATFDG